MSEENKAIDLIDVAMKIILHAGDARVFIKEAIDAVLNDDFSLAEEKLKASHQSIEQAHQYQTDIIQLEAKGITCEYSMLFTHAQDTLMTIYSELHLSERMMLMYKKLSEHK